jgi:cysteine desulfurase/selenocysteine lyase
MAGFGVAPFYVRRELLDRLQPDRVGWHVAKQLDGYQYEPYQDGRKYQFSSLAFGEVYQLAAALEYLEKVGLDRIEAHTLALTRELREGLVARGFRMFTPDATRSSVLSFYVDRPAADAERLLESAGVKVSGQTGDRTDNEGQPSSGVNRIRVAVSSFNNRSDIQHLLSAAEALRRA